MMNALLAICVLGGCDCGKEPPLATLTETSGDSVRRDFDASREQWEVAPIGATFALGDGVRADAPSSARLSLADGSELRVRPGTRIRFQVANTQAGEQAVDVETGEAVLVLGKRDMRLRTHVGMAVLSAGSQVVLRREGKALGYRIEVGEAKFTGVDGKTTAMKAGASMEVGIGMAVLRSNAKATPEKVEPKPTNQDAGDTFEIIEDEETADDGTSEPSLGYYNLAIAAGESCIIHAADVPVTVGFEIGDKCPGSATVEWTGGKQRFRGKGRINVAVAGARRYAIRCSEGRGIVARGFVHVLRDAGVSKLPTRAPTSVVEADGRSYTIYYQNQLPAISVRWPNPPAAQKYQLRVDGEAVDLTKPEHLFRSGTLRDGTHTLIFEAQQRRSRTATVHVSFDNAAPKASMSAPADRGFSPGDTVTVEGVALRAWKVSADRGTISIDAADRFSGQVVTSAEHPDIAVRLSHPKLGTHYYLRRAAGSP